jgi:hypothetical protein
LELNIAERSYAARFNIWHIAAILDAMEMKDKWQKSKVFAQTGTPQYVVQALKKAGPFLTLPFQPNNHGLRNPMSRVYFFNSLITPVSPTVNFYR